MRNGNCNILFVLLALSAWPAAAQAQPQKVLPAVLVIGDAVYQQARAVTQELNEQATVTFATWPAHTLPNSTNAIEHIDLLLGYKNAAGIEIPEDKRPTWNLVHLNVGLADLIHRVPDIQSHRSLPHNLGGEITTNISDYEKNLDTLIQLIKQKAPQAKIVWASTTPIRHSHLNLFKLGTEVQYNVVAERVMKKHEVPINDMHSFVQALIDMDKPASHGADPFDFDRKPIHGPIVEIIAKELKIEIKQPQPTEKAP